MKKFGIVGFGNMGEAFCAGLKKAFPQTGLIVMEKDSAKAWKARESYQAELLDKPQEMMAQCDAVILAVKPQDLADVLVKFSKDSEKKRFISLAAGKPLSFFEPYLKSNELVRFMPNLAAPWGKAVTGMCAHPQCSEEFRKEALVIGQAVGEVLHLPERLMPAITGLSGSGIAYVFQFAHALALGGVASGLGYDQALSVAIGVLEGASAVLRESGVHPIQMLSRVISPAGTTIAGVSALEGGAFNATVMEAVQAAADRAKELEA